MTNRYVSIAILAAITTTLLVSCGEPPNGGGQTVSAKSKGSVELSRLASFHSLNSLASNSVAVVVATAIQGSTHFEILPQFLNDPSPPKPPPGYTLTAFDVQRVISGKVTTGVPVSVRFVAGTTDFDGFVEGNSYILFLTAFEWAPGKPTGDFTPTGVFAGIYGLDGNSATKLDLGLESADLPAKVSVDQLVAAANPSGG